ncbi:MAG: AAA family ATPase [Chloroflexi bacterium]|nr:AAA family ATPase [Chloroflexota bacterium]
MLTRMRVNNFKKLNDVDIELGKTVVLIGPNNSGKTTALQALALWDIGLRRWNEKRQVRTSPEERPGVAINRRDLISIPIPDANLLWRDLHVRDIRRVDGKPQTQNIRIEIVVDGVTSGKTWSCGLEFDYANEESFYCRPLRTDNAKPPQRMLVPAEAATVQVAFLPPMSGLADREFIKQPGEIGVLIGQGQTAQVLRNLCYQIFDRSQGGETWMYLVDDINKLFGVTLQPPVYIKERSEITMSYTENESKPLDLSSSGRGLQQTLLLLAHLYANLGTVLLLDEPDAHLEVLRQRQIYQLLTEVAEKQDSQVIAASHSEIILNEAADRDVVIAFVGRPHRIDDRGGQVLKSLTDIGFDHYYQAEQTGWVLYLEGPTDLAILRAFAATLDHAAVPYLERPFVQYVATNLPQKARDHFYGLKEAKKDLVGVALFDRLDRQLHDNPYLKELMWQRREVENYLCSEEVLLRYAGYDQPDDLFGLAEADRRKQAMRESIDEVSNALRTLHKPEPWSSDIKASDDFLDPLFELFFKKLGLPNLLRKTDYHVLAKLVSKDEIDHEVIAKLDVIVAVASRAKPRTN